MNDANKHYNDFIETLERISKVLKEASEKHYEEPKSGEKGAKDNPVIMYANDEKEFNELSFMFKQFTHEDNLIQDPLSKKWCKIVIKEK